MICDVLRRPCAHTKLWNFTSLILFRSQLDFANQYDFTETLRKLQKFRSLSTAYITLHNMTLHFPTFISLTSV